MELSMIRSVNLSDVSTSFRSACAFGRYDMPLINVVIALIVVGVILWLINNYLPMDGKIKSILNGVVVVVVVLWLLQVFGVMGSLSSFRIGK